MDLQHITQEELEYIEKYLNGNLDPLDLKQFEQRLQTEAEFKSKVEDIKTVLTGIETQALKEQLDIFHEDIDNVSNPPEKEDTKVHTLNWKRLLVAAALIITAGSFWFLGGNSNERLYANYFTPDPGLPTTMGSSDNYDFYEAMVNYKQGDYKTAIAKWETLQKAKPNNDTLNYFIGVAYLANKNEEIAIPLLEGVAQNSEFALINDAHYYLGLAYLKADNVEKAKASLQKSNVENSKALLSELND
ncbi:tetratricopeptide repeat protein [Winogradskyella schleiferi]|uniref:tetratricopeptide repeat protein n=1 Tax=Winogradskyella schleiferi TaxID=2686078 RepID=UPI0015BB6742|nr:tetratricopeptide repeat protein [Winogradskyella schleiferi]